MNNMLLGLLAVAGIMIVSAYAVTSISDISDASTRSNQIDIEKKSESINAYLDNGTTIHVENTGRYNSDIAMFRFYNTSGVEIHRTIPTGADGRIFGKDNSLVRDTPLGSEKTFLQAHTVKSFTLDEIGIDSLGQGITGEIITKRGRAFPISDGMDSIGSGANKDSAGSGNGTSTINGMGIGSRINQLGVLSGRITHGVGVVGSDSSAVPYLIVKNGTDFAGLIKDSDVQTVYHIPELGSEYELRAERLYRTNDRPNVLGYSEISTKSGDATAMMTANGIRFSGNGTIIAKIHDISGQNLWFDTSITGNNSTNNNAMMLGESSHDLIDLEYSDRHGFMVGNHSYSHINIIEGEKFSPSWFYFLAHHFGVSPDSFGPYKYGYEGNLTGEIPRNLQGLAHWHLEDYIFRASLFPDMPKESTRTIYDVIQYEQSTIHVEHQYTKTIHEPLYRVCERLAYVGQYGLYEPRCNTTFADRVWMWYMSRTTDSQVRLDQYNATVSSDASTIQIRLDMPAMDKRTNLIGTVHVYDKYPHTISGISDQVLQQELDLSYSEDLYVIAHLDGSSDVTIGASALSDDSNTLEINSLPPNTPYQITRDGLVIATGMTNTAGGITLEDINVELDDDSSTGGFLHIYPDSLAYRGDFSTIVFDDLHAQTVHIDTVEEKVYVVHAYAQIPVTDEITVSNVNLDGVTLLPYLDGAYGVGSHISVPVIPGFFRINMEINGNAISLDYADILGGARIKIAESESSTINQLDPTRRILSIEATAGTTAFVIATSTRGVDAIVTETISGTASITNTYKMELVPPRPRHLDPLSGWVDVYVNGKFREQHELGINPHPEFTSTLDTRQDTSVTFGEDGTEPESLEHIVTHGVQYSYPDYVMSGGLSVDNVNPGDFVEFYLYAKIHGEIEDVTLVPNSRITAESGTATATATIKNASVQAST